MGKYIELIDETTPDLAVGSIYIGLTSEDPYREVTDDDAGDHFTDAVALMYEACGIEATRATSTINITDFSTIGSTTIETEFKTNIFPQHFNSLHTYAYSTIEGYPFYDHDGKYEDCTFRIPNDTYFYVRGSDPTTRRYVQFSYNNNQLFYKIWDHEKEHVIYQTFGSPFSFENVTAPEHMLTKFLLTDIEGFVHAATAQEARAFVCHASITIAYTSYRDTVVDSIIQYQVAKYFQNTNALDGLYHLLQSGADFIEPSDDPYAGDDGTYDPSDVGGGDGEGDPYDEGDDVPVPDLPDVGLTDSGLVTLYTPDQIQLHLLGSYLWSTNFVDSLVKSLYANPMDVIISVGLYPFNIVPAGVKDIYVGDRAASVGETVVTSNYPASEWLQFDCGTVNVAVIKNTYLDYSPYTKGQIFVPFVGVVPMDIDYVMGRAVGLVYNINLCTGQAVAYVTSNGNVVGQYSCNLKTDVPLSGADAIQMWGSLIQTAVAGVPLAIGGAAMGAAAIGKASTGLKDVASKAMQMGKAAQTSSSIISDIATKPVIEKSNAMGISGGFVGHKMKPHIILERPNLQQPAYQNKYSGYPAYITKKLSDCSGYTVVDSSRLSIPSATGKELAEIDQILKSGFIINGAPSIPSGDLVLFKNASPNNQIGKSITQVAALSGTFREEADITSLRIRIEYNNPTTFNYLYSAKTKRFYFVSEITLVRNGIIDVSCDVDVLESFGSEILSNEVIVGKNEHMYNLLLNDGGLKTLQKPLISRFNLPTGFGEDYEYVLVVAGSGSGT